MRRKLGDERRVVGFVDRGMHRTIIVEKLDSMLEINLDLLDTYQLKSIPQQAQSEVGDPVF